MTAQPLLAIVEDEPKIARLLADYAKTSGFDATVIGEGTGALEKILALNPAAVLLDINLPGVDGLTICRQLRERSEVPILLVTARVEEIDRLLGLELGADDYVCKPFSPREVMARVKVILRRVTASDATLQGPVTLDRDRYEARLRGTALDLTRTEFNLLAALMKRPGRVLSRDQLMDRAYDDHRVVSDRAIDSHIRNLRRKLSEASVNDTLIHSIYGVGYKYEPE